MQQQIPTTEAYQLGEKYHLGPFVAAYKTEYTRVDRLFAWFTLCFIFIILAYLCIGLISILSAGPTTRIFPWYLIFFPFYFFPVIYSNYIRKKLGRSPVSFFQRNLRVYLYDEGMVRINLHKHVIIRWDQIRQIRVLPVYTGNNPYVPVQLTVVRKDGKESTFSTIISGFDQLKFSIEMAYARHRYQQTRGE